MKHKKNIGSTATSSCPGALWGRPHQSQAPDWNLLHFGSMSSLLTPPGKGLESHMENKGTELGGKLEAIRIPLD